MSKEREMSRQLTTVELLQQQSFCLHTTSSSLKRQLQSDYFAISDSLNNVSGDRLRDIDNNHSAKRRYRIQRASIYGQENRGDVNQHVSINGCAIGCSDISTVVDTLESVGSDTDQEPVTELSLVNAEI